MEWFNQEPDQIKQILNKLTNMNHVKKSASHETSTLMIDCLKFDASTINKIVPKNGQEDGDKKDVKRFCERVQLCVAKLKEKGKPKTFLNLSFVNECVIFTINVDQTQIIEFQF